MTTKHLQVNIAFALAQIDRDIAEGRYPSWLVGPEGERVPVEEQIEALKAMQRDGYVVVPCGCDEVDESGGCKGL
jgi:hypothetical protein